MHAAMDVTTRRHTMNLCSQLVIGTTFKAIAQGKKYVVVMPNVVPIKDISTAKNEIKFDTRKEADEMMIVMSNQGHRDSRCCSGTNLSWIALVRTLALIVYATYTWMNRKQFTKDSHQFVGS